MEQKVHSHDSPRPAPPAAIMGLLAGLRRRVRAYIWADGLAAGVMLLALGFWLSLGIDWTLEPPAWLRQALLAIVVVLLAVVFYRFIARRAFVPLADRSMAVVLERRYPKFHDSLITVVELASTSQDRADYDPVLLSTTCQTALAEVEQVRMGEVLNTRPLAWRVALTLLLVASIAGFALSAREAMATWARRSLLLSNEPWPRRTHLRVKGFNDQGVTKVALGADFDLVVEADAGGDFVIPESAEIRFRDGRRETMSREGVALANVDPAQKYSYEFKSLLASVEFYVVGGDDRLGPLRIEAVESPTLSKLKLSCRYPDYMRRAADEPPVAGHISLPRGTHATVFARSNKALTRVQIDEPAESAGSEPAAPRVLELSGAREFQVELPPLEADKTLLFTLWDTDGVRSRDPTRVVLTSVPDEPPQVDAQLHGIGRAITPQATLPALGSATDDYGVAKAWFEYKIDEQEAKQAPITLRAPGATEAPLSGSLAVTDLHLQPKQKLSVAILAEDSYDLGPSHVGKSQRYALDVVTPEQLLSLIEARELSLRRRFETMIEELTETRNLLAKIGDEPAPPAPAAPGENAPKALTPDEIRDRRRTQIERAQQNVQRNQQDTLELSNAILEIHDELVNNAIDAPDRKERLKDGIALPLQKVGAEGHAELLSRVNSLRRVTDDPLKARPASADCVAQADQMIVEMRSALAKMIQLETYNEILDLVRDVIDAQKQVTERTRELHKEKVRNLLEE